MMKNVYAYDVRVCICTCMQAQINAYSDCLWNNIIWYEQFFYSILCPQFCALTTAYFSKATGTLVPSPPHWSLSSLHHLIISFRHQHQMPSCKWRQIMDWKRLNFSWEEFLLVHHVKRRERTSAFQQSEPSSSQHWMSPDLWLRHSTGLFSLFVII